MGAVTIKAAAGAELALVGRGGAVVADILLGLAGNNNDAKAPPPNPGSNTFERSNSNEGAANNAAAGTLLSASSHLAFPDEVGAVVATEGIFSWGDSFPGDDSKRRAGVIVSTGGVFLNKSITTKIDVSAENNYSQK